MQPQPVVGTGRCQFEDAASLDRCVNRGIKLLLREPLGGYCYRVLCSEHSDWIQASSDSASENRS